MRRFVFFSLISTVIAILATAPCARSQATVGVQKFGTYDGSPDVVDVGSLGQHLETAAATQLSKSNALQALQSVGASPAQIEAAKSFIQRATTATQVTIEKFSDGVLRVTMTRQGADGSQSFVRIINQAGQSNTAQRAVNAAGDLVHLDYKN